jgi:pimeloyl-ACP methyl ester carboxylesterase
VKDTQFIALPDKRKLCYAEFGDEAGFPVLYCHGFPASRLEARLGESEARRQGVRLIAIDRPGFGRSDFSTYRSILDWPDDAMALMRHLNIERFSVVGVSGGAPYAMSCALRLSEHIYNLGLVSGLGYLGDKHMAAQLRKPFAFIVKLFSISTKLGKWVTKQLIGRLLKVFPGFAISVIKSLSAEKDKLLLSEPAIRGYIKASLQEAFYQGSSGPAWEFFLYTKPWGFDLSRISVETYLWHGDNDRTVPLKMAEYHARMIPGAHLTVFPGEGHFSVPIRHLGTMLRTLRM